VGQGGALFFDVELNRRSTGLRGSGTKRRLRPWARRVFASQRSQNTRFGCILTPPH
jgi:hypothetical protein